MIRWPKSKEGFFIRSGGVIYYMKKSKRYLRRKLISLLMLMIFITTMIPPLNVNAASNKKPVLMQKYKYSYVGSSNTYTISNVKKGYTIKWLISKTVKDYISFSKDKHVCSKTVKVSDKTTKLKVYTLKSAKDKINAKYKVTAYIYDKKGSKVSTCTDEVKINIDATDIVINNHPENNLISVNTSFNFNKTLIPNDSVNKTFWIVTDENNHVIVNTKSKVKSNKVVMKANGIFSPKAIGTYKIYAVAYRSDKAAIQRAKSRAVIVQVIDPSIPTVTPTITVTPTPTALPVSVPVPPIIPPVNTTYLLTIMAAEGGTITIGTSGSYISGTEVGLSATPQEGYLFAGWTSSNGGSFGNATLTSTTFITPSNATTVTANFTKDKSTEEKLPDDIKDMLGLDKTKEDNDGDGLKDLYEFSYLSTSLLLVDTDGNGMSDADEDSDEDGLTNIQEQELGTRPDRLDSDVDGLGDGNEVNTYGTNPLNADTDGDGLIDGEEIKLGLNPNDPKSDSITPDNERKFEQSVSDSVKDDALLNSDNWLIPSISGNVPGDISRNVLIEKSDSYIFDDNRSVLSDVIDVQTTYELPLTLSFTYNFEYTGNARNLTIVSFGEEGLEIVETSIDETSKVISGSIAGGGTYFVIDLDEFLKGLGIDVFANIKSDPLELSELSFMGLDEEAADKKIREVEYDYLYDNDGNIIDQIEKPSEEINYTSIQTSAFTAYDREALSSRTVATGKADVVFVIDTTGSMSSSISDVKNNINIFAEKLVNDYNIDANFSLIEYRDITVDGMDSTMLHKNVSSSWFTNVNSFKSEVNTLIVGGGGDLSETPIDGLKMAQRLDWRRDAAKIIVLVTDADYKIDNNYDVSSMEEMASSFANDGIMVSAITYNVSIYSLLTNITGGLYGYIYGNFSDILLSLAEKVGEVTNTGGEWAFLNDFQAVKLSDTIANASINDTDNDGVSDAQELGTSVEKDMLSYIKALVNRYSIPIESYYGKTKITVWNYKSNPVLLDTDYDGISDGNKDFDGQTVVSDSFPKDNTFIGKLYYEEDDKKKESKKNIEFTVDYSLLFKNNRDYKKDLAVLASLYAANIYKPTYLAVTRGVIGGSYDNTELETLFGLKDVEDININGTDYGVDVDDNTEFVIGHRKIVFNGVTKEIILVVVRGTNGTNTEWSSNFDVGANTSEYYAATGSSHPDWLNKNNHKGFDVAANRILKKINEYLLRHSLTTSSSKAILITGHSRGAAIANLLGAHFEKDPNFMSFTYTFAAPNPTTDSDVRSYKTIFNIVNQDDIIPYLPLSSWGFNKYGIVKDISVEDHYENHWGTAQAGTWEWLTGSDYNNDGGTQRTLDAFAKIASNRNELYILDNTDDGTVWENNIGHITRAGAESELAELTNALRTEKLLKYCNLKVVGGGISYHVAVNYCPAYLMQMLANMTTKIGPTLGRDTTGVYASAKASFAFSSGKIGFGGMTHPHLPITYYLIVHNNFVNHV